MVALYLPYIHVLLRVPLFTCARSFGGMARIAAVVKQFRMADPETLYFDAGDQYVG